MVDGVLVGNVQCVRQFLASSSTLDHLAWQDGEAHEKALDQSLYAEQKDEKWENLVLKTTYITTISLGLTQGLSMCYNKLAIWLGKFGEKFVIHNSTLHVFLNCHPN
jgi:hypothetical protein